jgi:hypothetical protein
MTESQPSDIFQPGDILNNTYRIEVILGRGGTSEVYRARSEISGRVVALKVLSSEFSKNDDYLVLMTREEEIRDVRHDAVLRYSENNRSQDGHIYLVMDYIDGEGLDAILRSGGMSASDLLVLARRVSEGLVATHERNIVHRDLSPDNIILRGGDPSEAVIIDYGIAKDANPGAETIVGNEFAGKYAYAAPEQLSGKADARSDIYSLGALLLAAFRGKSPDVGANPMEVIQNKGKPLDTEGVPEPLKSLIDRMTDPEPDQRIQTAAEVIAQIAPKEAKTVVAVPPVVGVPASRSEKKPPAKKSRGGMMAIVLAGLLAALGAGAYFSGLLDGTLGASLPVADPYTLIAGKQAGGPPRAVGNMPSEKAREAIEARIAGLGGSSDVTLASGDIPDGWGADILALIGEVEGLDEWRVAATGRQVRVTGMSLNRSQYDSVQASLAGPGMPEGLQGSAEIVLGPRILGLADVEAVLVASADCGQLSAVNAPDTGFPMGAVIEVRGNVASDASQGRILAALDAIAGDRSVVLNTNVLTPDLCMIESHLPLAPDGGFDVLYGYGDRIDPNPDGVYAVGDNPVIDVVIPAGVVDGFLWVSVIDVSGNVYHLLPNINRPDNSIRSLRAGREGPVPVRVAFGLEESGGDASELAFFFYVNLGLCNLVVNK